MNVRCIAPFNPIVSDLQDTVSCIIYSSTNLILPMMSFALFVHDCPCSWPIPNHAIGTVNVLLAFAPAFGLIKHVEGGRMAKSVMTETIAWKAFTNATLECASHV